MYSQKHKKIGLIGGTFDPIHFGHLLAAERAREEYSLEKVYFIPSANPPHKNYYEMAESKSRFEMVETAIKDNLYFEISDMEFVRTGYSYTIDTVNAFADLMGQDCKIYFIIGTDNVGQILGWKNADELMKKVEFIAMTRPGKWEEELVLNMNKLKEKGCRINIVEMPLIHIESTDIRNRINNGLSVKYIVPEEVERYIIDNKLYMERKI
ncbi:MAG: nicotinate-nucleotide adenylyltransferase [Deltaproteobacteria bacterium]